MGVDKKKTIIILYFAASLISAILLVLLLSNLYWTQQRLGIAKEFFCGPYQPYEYTQDKQRFAINDLNQSMQHMVLSVSAESDDYTIEVHYQLPGDATFYPAVLSLTERVDMTSYYILDADDKVQNLYVDLYGTFEQASTLSVSSETASWGIEPAACALGFAFLLVMYMFFRLRSFFLDIYKNKEIVKMLVLNDLKSRYAGSFLGITWSFIQTVLTILVFWFVFQLGFKNPPVQDIPYILWFIPAYIPWMYFQEVAINATGCLREYSYLVKKIKFKISILPVIKVVSSFLIHLCFIAFMFFAYGVYGIKPSLMALQLLYYSFAMVFMVCGLSWLIAALSVFMKDLAQIIGIILQLGYFAIPVFWTEDMMAPGVLAILKLNPIYYIVQGYRDCMEGTVFFWQYPWLTVYFWAFSIAVFWGGITLFEKTQKHFADLL